MERGDFAGRQASLSPREKGLSCAFGELEGFYHGGLVGDKAAVDLRGEAAADGTLHGEAVALPGGLEV